MLNKYLLLLLCMMGLKASAQIDSLEVETDTIVMETDSLIVDTVEVVFGDNIITNTSALKLFFEKLQYVEEQKAGHVNIVHVGDSHIQADIMTGLIRKNLQGRFGNGGAGFTFPHNLVKTNGGHYIRFSSNASWSSRRNIYSAESGLEPGLSGIALKTRENFVVELNVREDEYEFNTIRIITPRNVRSIDAATSSKTITLESNVPKKITHRIKSGEVLGTIAEKYNTTISQLKKANGLKSDNIRAGKTLKIPTKEMQKKEVKRSEFIPLELQSDSLSHYYHSDNALSKIYLLPNREVKQYTLSGLVLEKDTPGILYHSIGVNGAKASDFNRFPLFFEQLPALKPDLVIISFGTNESFDKMSAAEYTSQLNRFIDNVRAQSPDACILVMTPPPSVLRRRYRNTYAEAYAKNITRQETDKNYASYDLFAEMGGLTGVKRNLARGILGGDKVHYTHKGYEKQGKLFTEALIKAYDNFKTNRN